MANTAMSTPTGQFKVTFVMKNEGPLAMTYDCVEYEKGVLAEGQSWPRTIRSESTSEVCSVGKPSDVKGCSGYVVYEIGTVEKVKFTFAFCNTGGENKVAIGTRPSSEVYSSMATWGYNPRTETFTIDKKPFVFTYQCTKGAVNNFTVDVKSA